MRVLVLESDARAADLAVHRHEAAGHEVVRCHDRGAPTFPCNALLPSRSCPLEDQPVDVTLVVRAHPWPRPTSLERGVDCAIRAGVPLVVAGSPVLNPYEDFATLVVEGQQEAVEACERAATAPLSRHSAAATAVLTQTLGALGVDSSGFSVEVTRDQGRLHAVVRSCRPLDRWTAGHSAVRVTGELRRVDRAALGVDVSFDPPVGREAVGS